MNIFISGKFLSSKDYEEFMFTAEMIRKLKLHPVHLANLPRSEEIRHEYHRKYSKQILSHSDAILMLPGWANSEASIREYKEARKMKMKILYSIQDLINWVDRGDRR